MADREAFLGALEKARAKMLHPDGSPIFPDWSRQIQYVFTDTDECWHISVTNGMPGPAVEEELFDPDVQFTMTTDMLVGLMNGTINGMKAFMTGQVKVKASMADIKMLQTLV